MVKLQLRAVPAGFILFKIGMLVIAIPFKVQHVAAQAILYGGVYPGNKYCAIV